MTNTIIFIRNSVLKTQNMQIFSLCSNIQCTPLYWMVLTIGLPEMIFFCFCFCFFFFYLVKLSEKDEVSANFGAFMYNTWLIIMCEQGSLSVFMFKWYILPMGKPGRNYCKNLAALGQNQVFIPETHEWTPNSDNMFWNVAVQSTNPIIRLIATIISPQNLKNIILTK